MGIRGKRSNKINKKRRKKAKKIKTASIEAEALLQLAAVSSDPPPDLISNFTPSPSQIWSDLPQALLLLILDRISYSLPDLLSFAAVCRSWRSAAAFAARGPPLLLTPLLAAPTRHFLVRWSGSPRCLLQTLTLTSDRDVRAYRSRSTPKTLAKCCIGCFNSHLILLGADNRNAILADVFTAEEIHSPDFPSGRFHFTFGILTAPPASPSCYLLLVALNTSSDVYSILCWRLRSSQWSQLKLDKCPEIISLIAFKGQILGLDSLYRLIVVELDPCMSWKVLPAQLSTGPFLYCFYGRFTQHLVECDGELLAVLFVPTGKFWVPGAPKIEVYRLNLSEFVWEKKECLGNWCLFIDAVGKCSVSCHNPSRWGGKENCLYIAGPGYDSCSVYPVDGEPIDMTIDSALCPSYLSFPKWPSTMWVYPSTLF